MLRLHLHVKLSHKSRARQYLWIALPRAGNGVCMPYTNVSLRWACHNLNKLGKVDLRLRYLRAILRLTYRKLASCCRKLRKLAGYSTENSASLRATTKISASLQVATANSASLWPMRRNYGVCVAIAGAYMNVWHLLRTATIAPMINANVKLNPNPNPNPNPNFQFNSIQFNLFSQI